MNLKEIIRCPRGQKPVDIVELQQSVKQMLGA